MNSSPPSNAMLALRFGLSIGFGLLALSIKVLPPADVNAQFNPKEETQLQRMLEQAQDRGAEKVKVEQNSKAISELQGQLEVLRAKNEAARSEIATIRYMGYGMGAFLSLLYAAHTFLGLRMRLSKNKEGMVTQEQFDRLLRALKDRDAEDSI